MNKSKKQERVLHEKNDYTIVFGKVIFCAVIVQ
jgi:hypothetical protein